MTHAEAETNPNPLERAAVAFSLGTVMAVAVVARLAAVALALFVAFDESYDETQVFAVAIAVVGLATAAPLRSRTGGALAVFGAAMLLYAGALLFNVSVGPLLLLAGGVATLAALAENHQRHATGLLPVAALLVAMGAITALVLVIVFAVGG